MADLDVAFDQGQGLTVIFNEGHSFRPTAQSFQAKGTGTGKEIKDIGLFSMTADYVE